MEIKFRHFLIALFFGIVATVGLLFLVAVPRVSASGWEVITASTTLLGFSGTYPSPGWHTQNITVNFPKAGKLLFVASTGHDQPITISSDLGLVCDEDNTPEGFRSPSVSGGSYHFCMTAIDYPAGDYTLAVYSRYSGVDVSWVILGGVPNGSDFLNVYATTTDRVNAGNFTRNITFDRGFKNGILIDFLATRRVETGYYDGQYIDDYFLHAGSDFTPALSPIGRVQGINYSFLDTEKTSYKGDFYMGLVSGFSPTQIRQIVIAIYEEDWPVNWENTFYQEGGYNVPRSIKCYGSLSSCNMVFSYDMGVLSRSLASTSPDMPNYPRFGWHWPNTEAPAISSSTIRKFIDYGFLDQVVNFTFPIPTSTTNYVLAISDPNNPAGSAFDFVVNVNFIAGYPEDEDLFKNCVGSCEESFFGAIYCGLKKAGCWAFIPDPESWLYISGSWNGLRAKFPFSVVGDITNTFLKGVEGKTDDRSQGFSVIMADKNGDFYLQPVMSSSSLSDTIGSDNAILFRKSIVWFMWAFVAGGVLFFIFRKK